MEKSIVRKFAIRVVDGVGLGGVARRAKENGWAPWTPLVPEGAFRACCRTAIETLRRHGADEAIGDYLEFGVSRGTSLACMHQALDRAGLRRVRLFGFDSFEGLPPEAAGEGWRPGAFRSAEGATRRYLDRAGVDWSRVTLVKGWFRDTLTDGARDRLGLRKASLIMVDCDTYAASLECLRFCEPLIRDRAVVFLDDWGNDPNDQGEKRAFTEFLADCPHFSAEPLPAYAPAARVFLVTRRPNAPPA
jgi:predicted O-methyltransferase YrrM